MQHRKGVQALVADFVEGGLFIPACGRQVKWNTTKIVWNFITGFIFCQLLLVL